MSLLPAPNATRRKVVVVRDMHEIEAHPYAENPAENPAEPAHSSASDQCTVASLKPRRTAALDKAQPSLPQSSTTDCATSSIAEGFGDSSAGGSTNLGKRAASVTQDTTDGDHRTATDGASQERGAPRPRTMTWLMALHDATNPTLPTPDLHKALPTSYVGQEDDVQYPSKTDAGPSGGTKKASSGECSYVSSMLHALYHGPSCSMTSTLVFDKMADEAKFYVRQAASWLRRHLTVLTVMCMLTTLAVAHTALPAPTDQCDWVVTMRAPSYVRAVLHSMTHTVLTAVNALGSIVAALFGLPDKVDSTLLVSWHWVAMHLLLQLLVCAPMHLLSLLPKARRLQLLEPVTQVLQLWFALVVSFQPTHPGCPCRHVCGALMVPALCMHLTRPPARRHDPLVPDALPQLVLPAHVSHAMVPGALHAGRAACVCGRQPVHAWQCGASRRWRDAVPPRGAAGAGVCRAPCVAVAGVGVRCNRRGCGVGRAICGTSAAVGGADGVAVRVVVCF